LGSKFDTAGDLKLKQTLIQIQSKIKMSTSLRQFECSPLRWLERLASKSLGWNPLYNKENPEQLDQLDQKPPQVMPRRSARLANRPPVKYFTDDYFFEQALQDYCDKNNFEYSDELIADYKEFLAGFRKGDESNYYWPRDKNITKEESVYRWAAGWSARLNRERKLRRNYISLVIYCAKNNVPYEHSMLERFTAWLDDPVNDKIIRSKTYTSKAGRTFNDLYQSQGYLTNYWFGLQK
jgi:hypothetical protein